MTHELNKFPCTECNFKAKNKGGLTRHINSRHKMDAHNISIVDQQSSDSKIDEVEGNFSCDECDYKTQITHDYMAHANYAHFTEQTLFCDKCDFQTQNDEDFTSHLTLIHNTKIISPYD